MSDAFITYSLGVEDASDVAMPPDCYLGAISERSLARSVSLNVGHMAEIAACSLLFRHDFKNDRFRQRALPVANRSTRI